MTAMRAAGPPLRIGIPAKVLPPQRLPSHRSITGPKQNDRALFFHQSAHRATFTQFRQYVRDIHWTQPSIKKGMKRLLGRSVVHSNEIPRPYGITEKLHIRRFWFHTIFAAFTILLFTASSWCRLMFPPSMADVRSLAENAPAVFRGRVLAVAPITSNTEPGARVISLATFQVDRWYRGMQSTLVSLNFAYSNFGANGHDCIDFRPDSYWIVFAVERNGQLEMTDDCIGALTISSLLGPNLGGTDWLAQMEADFLAGLSDHESEARLASIQRLGGLKLASSRNALHKVIEDRDELASKWAVYAALRTGDVTVLPRANGMLALGDTSLLENAIAMELQYVSDPGAVPDLLAILKSAPSDLTRTCVLIALAEKLKDPRAVPVLAAYLSDPNPSARYEALYGLKNITHEDACTLPPEWKEGDVEPQIRLCKTWWEQEGKLRFTEPQ
jgi:hypothetical protein